MTNRRSLCSSLLTYGLAPHLLAQARPKLVGVLFPWSSEGAENLAATLVEELRGLGYQSGKHFNIVVRAAEGKNERLPELARELVKINTDVFVAATTNAASAAQLATRTIPIVFYSVAEPVKSGFADSLAHPGHNMTGVSNAGTSLDPKRLDLMKQMVPGLQRVAYLLNPTSPFYRGADKTYHALAESLGLRALIVNAGKAEDLEPAFREIKALHAQALVVMGDTYLFTLFEPIAVLAIRNRLPSMASFAAFAAAGGLMAYATSIDDVNRQVAAYEAKIFRNAKPEDIPISEPTRFDFVINRKTADLLKVMIPPTILLQATRVLE